MVKYFVLKHPTTKFI